MNGTFITVLLIPHFAAMYCSFSKDREHVLNIFSFSTHRMEWSIIDKDQFV